VATVVDNMRRNGMALQRTMQHDAGRQGFEAFRGQLRNQLDDGQRWLARSLDRLDPVQVARGLGWFSIALGSVELLAPGAFARALGARGTALGRGLTRFCGVRELAAGVGILTTPRSASWMSSRVIGDVMDVALLLGAMGSPYARRGRLAMAAVGAAPIMALDAWCAQQLAGAAGAGGAAARTRKSVTINRSPEELYRFWRDVSNFPRFMRRIESVRATSDRRSHWVARAPGGMRVEWDSEFTDERPPERLAWRSLPGAQLETAGTVTFQPAPAGRGTQVTVEMEYTPPGREMTAQLLKLVGQAPEQDMQEDLRRFKQLMETGEIIVAREHTGAAEPSGAVAGTARAVGGRVLSLLKGGAR
jgi:uncharacterized membrane protein